MKNIKGKMSFVITLVMAIAVVLGSMTVSFAASSEVPATGVIFPSNVTIKVGETRELTVKLNPYNSTYLTNIQWGFQPCGHITCETNGSGSYWGKPCSENITGTSVGKAYLINTVKVYDSKKKFIKQYPIKTTVTVVAAGTSSGKNNAKSQNQVGKTQTQKAAKDGYVSVGNAYKDLMGKTVSQLTLRSRHTEERILQPLFHLTKS